MLRNWLTVMDPFEEMQKNFFDVPFFADSNSVGFGTDITDEGDSFKLTADLPGFKKEDVNVKVNGNTVTISAERHNDIEDKDKKDKFLHQERSYGLYKRSFNVGDNVDKANITAKYDNGILTVTLPKINEPEDNATDVTVE